MTSFLDGPKVYFPFQIMAMWLGRAAFRVTGFLDIKIKGKKVILYFNFLIS